MPARLIGLCMGAMDAGYATTTEVYPDSPSATPEQCIQAQVRRVGESLKERRAQAQFREPV